MGPRTGEHGRPQEEAACKGRIVRPNAKPGLGIVIDEAEVKKHPFEQELPQRVFYTDGSVGDW